MNVLVCGATGTTGGEVVRHLTEAGVTVRAMTAQPVPVARDHCLAPERADAPIYGGR